MIKNRTAHHLNTAIIQEYIRILGHITSKEISITPSTYEAAESSLTSTFPPPRSISSFPSSFSVKNKVSVAAELSERILVRIVPYVKTKNKRYVAFKVLFYIAWCFL